MKNQLFVLVVTILSVFLMWTCSEQPATMPDESNSASSGPISLFSSGDDGLLCVATLWAGQHIEVGIVTIKKEGENLIVKYQITQGDWIITETHLYVGPTPPDKGSPGKFPYMKENVDDTVDDYTIALDDVVNENNCFYVAAHAVVISEERCSSEAVLYGVERGSGGDLYTVDVVGGTATLLFDVDDPVPDNVNSPNGLAYDATTGRLYFSASLEGAASSDLYFYDGSGVYPAGNVPGQVAGATFYNGEYYYIINATDDLVKIIFDADGNVMNVENVCPDFADNEDSFRFGDIVITPDGSTLYGSSLTSGSTAPTFFSIDLVECEYTEISTSSATGLQLAFGSDGKLYGQSTGTGEFFLIDPGSGATVSKGIPTGANDGFTDIASGPQCDPEETAWAQIDEGGNVGFKGGWGSYFNCCIPCQDVGLINGGFEDPKVTSSYGWNIYDSGTPNLGWTVEWVENYPGAPTPAHLELHETGTVVPSNEGNQYAELDTDWDGPPDVPGGGTINNEKASVKIYQNLNTCPGQTYTLTYAWRGRQSDSKMEVYVAGEKKGDHADNTTQWIPETVTFTATDWTTKLEFIETGTPDSFGMFLDAVSVECTTCP
jgi:hypothetical protein